MFINDGKSLFSNTKLIIAIIVLVIVMLFSYNRCVERTESFDANTPDTPEPIDVRINIKNNTVALNFGVDTTGNKPLPKNFLIILVQYDSKLQNTGNNKFYMSNEYEINTSVSNTKTANNLCSLVNGMPSCSYVFTGLDIHDANGEPYYYKIGLAAIYDNGNSNFVLPYNVSSTNKLFTLTNNIDQQNSLYDEFLEYKKSQMQSGVNGSGVSNSDIIASADGQYELIKSQLGGYPSNINLNDPSIVQNSLADLVDKSMALGILNVDVSTPNIKNSASI